MNASPNFYDTLSLNNKFSNSIIFKIIEIKLEFEICWNSVMLIMEIILLNNWEVTKFIIAPLGSIFGKSDIPLFPFSTLSINITE